MEPLLIVILVGVAAWSAAVAVREFRRQAERRRMAKRLEEL